MKQYELKANTRYGSFNLLDPRDESYCVRLTLGEKHISVTGDYLWELNGFVDPDDAVELLETWLKKIWVSSQKDDVEAFVAYLKSSKKKIREANKDARLAELYTQREEIQRKIDFLLED